MYHTIELRLDTLVSGLFLIQPGHEKADVADAIEGFVPPQAKREFIEAYDAIEGETGGCFCRDERTPWVVVVFLAEPDAMRRAALREVVRLADRLLHTREMRARFIERVYFEIRIPETRIT